MFVPVPNGATQVVDVVVVPVSTTHNAGKTGFEPTLFSKNNAFLF